MKSGAAALASRAPAVLTIAAIALFVFEAWEPVQQADDAYIYYRYASNLAAGEGLVYNPGERVEGITNLPWTFLEAAGFALGAEAPWIGHVLGVVSSAWLLWLGFALARAGLEPRLHVLAALVPWLLLASSSFVRWSISGMGSSLFAATVAAALLAQIKGKPALAAVVAFVATTTRPEGALVAGAIFATTWWNADSQERRRLGAWIPAGGYAAAILLLTLFRVVYYGDIVPNTFHAKVGGIPIATGFLYLWGFLQDGALVLLPAAILGAIRTPSLRASALFIVVLVIYVVSIGGDVFPKGRFLLPTLAPMAALAIHACQSLTSQRLRALVAVTIPVGVFWSALWDTQAFDIAQRRESWRRFNLQPESFVRRQVERLMAASPPPKLVAHGAIGRFGYYANDIAILDIFGLVDRVVATTPRTSRRHGENEIRAPGHYRSNPEYVFGRRPDFIFIPPRDPTDRLGVPAILDLWADPRLERDYVYDEKLRAYERRDRLRSRR